MNEFVKKVSLTPQEKIKAAYLHYCRGIDQHIIAGIVFDDINQGRVNEACKMIWRAVGGEPAVVVASSTEQQRAIGYMDDQLRNQSASN